MQNLVTVYNNNKKIEHSNCIKSFVYGSVDKKSSNHKYLKNSIHDINLDKIIFSFIESEPVDKNGEYCEDYRISEFIFKKLKEYPTFLEEILKYRDIHLDKIPKTLEEIYILVRSGNKYFQPSDIEETKKMHMWLDLSRFFEESSHYQDYQDYFLWISKIKK